MSDHSLIQLCYQPDDLQRFLERVVLAINSFSKRLDTAEKEKLTQIEAAELLADGTGISNPSILKEIGGIKKQAHAEDPLLRVNYKLLNKFQQFGRAFDLLYNNDKKKEGFIDRFEKLLQPKADLDFVKQKVQEARIELKNSFELEIVKLRQAIKQLETRNEKNCLGVENRLKDVQKRTIGRIGECHTLLQNKATTEYVDLACQQVESKFNFQIKNIHKNGANDALFKLGELGIKMEGSFAEASNSSRELRTKVKELEEVLKGVERKEKAESLRKDLDCKLHQLTVKVMRLEGQQDSELEERVNRTLGQVRLKLNETALTASQTAAEFSSISQILAEGKGHDSADLHKICSMDAEIKRMRAILDKHSQSLGSIELDTRLRLLGLEEKLADNLALVKGQQHQVSKAELNQNIGRLRQTLSQQLSDIAGQFLEISKKMAKIELFERATKKKIKDLLANEDNKTLLASKMDVSEGRGSFDRVGARLSTCDQSIQRLRADTDIVLQFIAKLQQQLGSYEEGISIIAGRHRVVPQKCISCGTKYRPLKQAQEMGSDGRLYRVDVKGCNGAFDSPEVFDVMPSQMGFVPQAGSSRRDRVNSSKPTSEYTGLVGSSLMHTSKGNFVRPHSAVKS